MTAVAVSPSGPAALPAWALRRGTGFYGLSLLGIYGGYYAFWWTWKLKAYYLGWSFCLLVIVALLISGHLRMTGIVRDIAPVLVWYAYQFTSALWSPSTYDTLYFASAGLVGIVAFVAGYAWFESTSARALAAYFELQTLVLLPIILFRVLTLGRLYDDSLGAARTGFASICLTALPFLIWRVRDRPSIATTATLMFALLLIVSGESRSGLLIAPILIIGSLLFVGRHSGNRRRSIAMVGGIALGVALMVLAVPAVQTAIARSFDRLAGQTSLSVSQSILDEVGGTSDPQADIERRLSLFVSLRSFAEHPVLGAGYESTLTIVREQFGWDVSAHGLPSTLLGETGLVGTVLFGWMIARFYRRVCIASRRNLSARDREFLATCKLGMLGILILGLFHQVDQNPSLYLLLAWGYACARSNPGGNTTVAGARPSSQ